MKKGFLSHGMILGVSFVLIFSTLTFSLETDIIRLQGLIMNLDLKQNMIIVNEKTFIWDPKTFIADGKSSPISMDKFKLKSWVYIEGVKDKKNHWIIIEKIYLLPKYVDNKERRLYPFMQ